MTISEKNRVLRRRYNLHKQLDHTYRRYPKTFGFKYPQQVPPFVREKYRQLLDEYFATDNKLVELTREDLYCGWIPGQFYT